MILLHLRDNSSILLNPRHIKYIEKYPNYTYILYDVGDKIIDKYVVETPEEIQKLINEHFMPFFNYVIGIC